MATRRYLALIATVTLMISTLLIQARPAAAFSTSIYSVAVDDAYPNLTTGVFTSNAYSQLALSGSNCFTRYAEAASPVVFSHWVLGDVGNTSQVELGVEQQCSGYTFLFWGWRTSSAGWTPLGAVDITASSTAHTFDIHRLGNVWYFLYDGAQQGPGLVWALSGNRAEAGLESANSTSSVPTHWFSGLQLTVNEGAWFDFGYNTVIISPPSWPSGPMCGAWSITYTRWSAAENNSC